MIKYFYILTLSWTVGRDVHVQTRSGIATADKGQTQESIHMALFSDSCKIFNAPPDAAGVTFYYLARNET